MIRQEGTETDPTTKQSCTKGNVDQVREREARSERPLFLTTASRSHQLDASGAGFGNCLVDNFRHFGCEFLEHGIFVRVPT